MADINDRLDRLHRWEAFDQRRARPGDGTPDPEPDPEPAARPQAEHAAARRQPEYAHVGVPTPPRSPAGLPQRLPAHPARAASPAPARLQSREEGSRSGLSQRASGQAAAPHRPAVGGPRQPEPARPAEAAGSAAPPRPVLPRPAGVDDRLGEVLDAVAEVVRRHPGLSVMVALADGRPGRLVLRVSERGGEVETGVVIAGAGPARSALPPEPTTAPGPEGRPGAWPGAESPRPASPSEAQPRSVRPRSEGRLGAGSEEESGSRFAGARPEDELGAGSQGESESRFAGARPDDELGAGWERATRPEPAPARRPGGRHAAPPSAADDDRPGGGTDDEPAARPDRTGPADRARPTRSSWHYALWSADRTADHSARPTAVPGAADPAPADPAPADPPPADPPPWPSSQVVSRLAQLLREDPSLASSWGREAPDG